MRDASLGGVGVCLFQVIGEQGVDFLETLGLIAGHDEGGLGCVDNDEVVGAENCDVVAGVG